MSTPAVPGIDTSRANVARTCAAALGGKDTFAADRALAARLDVLLPAQGPGRAPAWREMAAANRAFLDRAVTWAAGQGIRQFLDLGAGMPVTPGPPLAPGLPPLRNVHQAARDACPDARVAAVDHDEVVLLHLRALVASQGITAAGADITAPGRVLGHPDVAAVIDVSAPACLIAGMVLHFMPAGQAAGVMAAYAARLAAGSVIAVSAARIGPRAWEQVRETWTAATGTPLWNHGERDVAAFLAGTDMVAPGVVSARGWSGGWADALPPDGPGYVLAAAGIRR